MEKLRYFFQWAGFMMKTVYCLKLCCFTIFENMVHLYVNYEIVLGFVVYLKESVLAEERMCKKTCLLDVNFREWWGRGSYWDEGVIISMKHILQYLKLKRYIIITPITTWQG